MLWSPELSFSGNAIDIIRALENDQCQTKEIKAINQKDTKSNGQQGFLPNPVAASTAGKPPSCR